MTTIPDIFLAQLIRDYLADTETGAADEELPKAVMDNGLEPERPSVLIAAREAENESRGPRRVLDVSIMLMTWLRADSAAAATNSKLTTRTEAMALLHAMDRRLRDLEAFTTWLVDLPEARLEGYSILKIVHRGAAAPMRDKETGATNYAVTQRWSLAVSREI